MSITMKTILALVMASVIGGGVLYSTHAQSQARTNGQSADQKYAVSVPIKFVDAQMRNVPSALMMGLTETVSKEASDRAMDVVDVSFAVSSKSADALAPSLQPRLFVGGEVYNVQRVEYDNWDPRTERTLDKSKPTGETLYYHFFLPFEQAMELGESELTFLTTLEKAEIMKATKGEFNRKTLERIDGNLWLHTIKLDRKAVMEAKK